MRGSEDAGVKYAAEAEASSQHPLLYSSGVSAEKFTDQIFLDLGCVQVL